MKSTFVYTPKEDLIAWAQERMRPTYPDFVFRSDARAIGHARGGRLVAVVVYDTLTDGDCMVHVVSDGSRGWFSRSFAAVAMAYPFNQMGFRRISALVSELNEQSLKFSLKFGWQLEGYLREAGPVGEGLLVFGMLRRECPWLPPLDEADTFRCAPISGIEGWKRAQDVLSNVRRTSNGQIVAVRT